MGAVSRSSRSRARWAAAGLVLLVALTSAGLALRDDPPPHVLSGLEFRFPEPKLQEPEKPGFFERHGGFIRADAGTDCGGLGGGDGPWPPSSYPIGASEIHSTEIDCTQARALVEEAHRHKPCKLHGCEVGGFKCRGIDAYSQTVEIVCRDGRSQVAWLWSGGY
jgi:hypothetical protein